MPLTRVLPAKGFFTMPDQQPQIVFAHDDFECETLEDELRVDERCRTLLQQFYSHLQLSGLTPEKASELAYGADYYVRDYLIDFSQQNLARPQAGLVKRFAATWYITRTLEPDMTVLARYLDAIDAFYRFLRDRHLISAEELQLIEAELALREYYHGRIRQFLALKGDGYDAWERECPLQEGKGTV